MGIRDIGRERFRGSGLLGTRAETSLVATDLASRGAGRGRAGVEEVAGLDFSTEVSGTARVTGEDESEEVPDENEELVAERRTVLRESFQKRIACTI